MTPDILAARLNEVRPRLGGAQLVAVTKQSPFEHVRMAYDLGLRDFGENRVQALSERAAQAQSRMPEARWHMIGHLQSNKVPALMKVPNLVAIHSVDSLDLLKRICAHTPMRTVMLFLEVNVAGEAEKHGFESLDALRAAFRWFHEFAPTDFTLQGLMGMGLVRVEDFEASTKKSFAELAALRDTLKAEFPDFEGQLSMGMSSDYAWAVGLGTDWVRLGSTLFKD